MMRRIFLIALVGSVAFPAAAVASKDDDGQRERRICKREVTLGSNVRQKRTCLTKKEWEQAEAYNRQTTKEWANAIDGKVRGN